MGVQDRDWWKDAQKSRAKQEVANGESPANLGLGSTKLTTGLKLAPLGIVIFWIALMAALYVAMTHYLKPKPVTVSASGDLVIPRARDGHFYASGLVNGRPVNFLIDTGASLVTVSEEFARTATMSRGISTVFKTANGDMPGQIVSDVPVTMGPISVSGLRVAVGLVGHQTGDALLGQNFLSKFEIALSKNQMILRRKNPV